MEFVYVIYFLVSHPHHIPPTLLLDLQSIYPKDAVPAFMSGLLRSYFDYLHDPLVGSAAGFYGEKAAAEMLWLKSFMALEAVFQLPVFFIGSYCLIKGIRSIYPLLLIYGASTATTTLPCLVYLYTTPNTDEWTQANNVPSVTPEERLILLSSYVPYFAIPLIMALDMAARLGRSKKTGKAAKRD
ncbi:transmembrane protein 6/97 [Schizophyllum amplum]|uniref:Efficient mitochondria targeting-associated protein 19 n=1 Tax=Schizophyllum amplum TaxID=97359 RepID=A0A550C6M2_9AGAR|nr:transmembrane protein 6/97 [Auriculariopsis ampla]